MLILVEENLLAADDHVLLLPAVALDVLLVGQRQPALQPRLWNKISTGDKSISRFESFVNVMPLPMIQDADDTM